MRRIERIWAQRFPMSKDIAEGLLAFVVVGAVAMMLVPLPPIVLDLLITANIAVAVIIVVTGLYVKDALAFSSFPTVILVTTLYRLALNVSSTRLILAQADPGEVIQAFGQFVTRGDLVVGAVVFAILTIVQLLVVTKGSERVAEVGARFTLDALPGKQMAIDADLRTGATQLQQAQDARRKLAREGQFFGAMDGAMKFVRGDAIAGLVIVAINLVGGLGVGVLREDMAVPEALHTYAVLTVGDGLVSQIPSLLISITAGLVTTRVAAEREEDSLGADIMRHVFSEPRVLLIAAVFLFLLACVPGFPPFPFLTLAVVCVIGRRSIGNRRRQDPGGAGSFLREAALEAFVPRTTYAQTQAMLREVVETLSREFGVGLPHFEITSSSTNVVELRRFGALFYRGSGVSAGDQLNIELALRRQVVGLVGFEQVQDLLDHLRSHHAAIVEHVYPRKFSLPKLTLVLRRLLEEGVPLRPLPTLMETLAACEPRTSAAQLVEHLRYAIREHMIPQHAKGGTLRCICVHPDYEECFRDYLREIDDDPQLLLPRVMEQEVIAKWDAADGSELPFLVTADLRRPLYRFLSEHIPQVTVLSHREVPANVSIEVVSELSPFTHQSPVSPVA